MASEALRSPERERRGGLWLVWAVPVLLALIGAPAPAAAQQPSGLTKADVVRLLADPSMTQGDVAAAIHARCLTFEPNSGDLNDFRRLGATSAVMNAIDGCVRKKQAAPRTGSEPQRPRVEQRTPAPSPAQVRLQADSVRVAAGSPVTIPIRVERAGKPVGGVRVVARGSGSLPGATGADASATTSADGSARLRFDAPGKPGRYQVRVQGSDRATLGGGTFTIRVLAGEARSVIVQPEQLNVVQGGLDTLSVTVVVHDTAGNGVPDAEVRLRKSESGGREIIWHTTTGSFGLADFRLPADLLRGGDTLSVLVHGTVLARLPVTGAREERASAASDSMEADLARGRSLLDAGRAGEAMGIFDALVRRDPKSSDALVGLGRALLAQGSADRAASRFHDALRVEPGQVDAMEGLASIARDRGDLRGAAAWLRSAAEHRPDDPNAWTELGSQYVAAGEPALARSAFERALMLDPGSSDARAGLRRVREAVSQRPPYAEGFVWGGKTLEPRGGSNGRSAGFRRGGLAVWPVPDVRLRAYYDNALMLDHPGLVRGEVDLRGVWGDVLLTYGGTGQYSTLLGYGRRGQPPYDVGESVFEVAQTVRVGGGLADFDRISLRLGGLLGHWYDRTDYLVTTSIGIPLSPIVRLEPRFSYGETESTVGFSQRYAAKEGRFTLGAVFRAQDGIEVHPTISYGDVTADTAALSGGLLDMTLQALVPIARNAKAEVFVRYQSPPGRVHFTQVGVGLVGLVPR